MRGTLTLFLNRERLEKKDPRGHMALMVVTERMAARDNVVSLEYLAGEVSREELVLLGYQVIREKVASIQKV
jgi:hypothetical protein